MLRLKERDKKGERITMVVELSKRLGVGTTKLKQLFSISNYQPRSNKKHRCGRNFCHTSVRDNPG